ncbi:MAG TPA: tail fiber protein [Solimonas sp.]|nr:tail fiber protein [Solimonas sp.]
MAQPYVGEIRMFCGNFAPAGWMFCEGQVLAIFDYDTLFNLIGTTYGGDGQETFALPDLRGRLPLHQGNGFILAETGGAEDITLTTTQLPSHSHALALAGNGAASSRSPAQAALAQTTGGLLYGDALPDTTMAATVLADTGGAQPHSNMQPYLCINFIISLYGIFPSPS